MNLLEQYLRQSSLIVGHAIFSFSSLKFRQLSSERCNLATSGEGGGAELGGWGKLAFGDSWLSGLCLPSLPERLAVTPFIMAATSFSLEASSGDDAASPLRGEGKAEPFAKEGFKEGSKEGSVRQAVCRHECSNLPT